MARTAILTFALLAALIAAPLASAHNTVQTDDGEYFLTVGHRSEPTATFLRSGLDLIIRENNDGERGDEVPDLAGALQATLISPSGEEFSQPLTLQHGAVGRYSFGDPYILTESGQYKLRLVGTIGTTVVDGTYDVSGPLDDYTDLTFPRTDVQTLTQLQERIDDLETKIAALEAANENDDEPERVSEGIPGPAPVVFLGALGALALLRRRVA